MRPPHEHQQHCESSFSNVQPPSVERNAKRFWSNASDVVAAEREENENFYRESEKNNNLNWERDGNKKLNWERDGNKNLNREWYRNNSCYFTTVLSVCIGFKLKRGISNWIFLDTHKPKSKANQKITKSKKKTYWFSNDGLLCVIKQTVKR